MRVKVKDKNPCRKELHIKVPADKITEEYGKMLAAYRKQSKIPGFRPGKAPVDLVEKRFSKDIIQEVKDRIIPESYHKAIDQEKIDVVMVLNVNDVVFEKDKDLTFVVTLDVPPAFKLPAYKKIKLKGEKVEVTDQKIEETINAIRSQSATFDDLTEGTVSSGDLVKVDFEGFCGKKTIEAISADASGLSKAEDFWVFADENAFLPGFGEALIGAAIGEDREINISFDKKFTDKKLAGKKARYQVKITGLRQKKLPEMDDEFFKQLGVESESDLRKRLQEDLERSEKQKETSRRKNEIIKKLMDGVSFDLPESLVYEETRNTVHDIVREHSSRGLTQEVIEEKKDEIFEAATSSAKDKVKLRYILHKIAEEEKIEISAQEYQMHVAGMAYNYQMEPLKLLEQLKKNNLTEKTKDDVRMHKTLEYLLGVVDIQE